MTLIFTNEGTASVSVYELGKHGELKAQTPDGPAKGVFVDDNLIQVVIPKESLQIPILIPRNATSVQCAFPVVLSSTEAIVRHKLMQTKLGDRYWAEINGWTWILPSKAGLPMEYESDVFSLPDDRADED